MMVVVLPAPFGPRRPVYLAFFPRADPGCQRRRDRRTVSSNPRFGSQQSLPCLITPKSVFIKQGAHTCQTFGQLDVCQAHIRHRARPPLQANNDSSGLWSHEGQTGSLRYPSDCFRYGMVEAQGSRTLVRREARTGFYGRSLCFTFTARAPIGRIPLPLSRKSFAAHLRDAACDYPAGLTPPRLRRKKAKRRAALS